MYKIIKNYIDSWFLMNIMILVGYQQHDEANPLKNGDAKLRV